MTQDILFYKPEQLHTMFASFFYKAWKSWRFGPSCAKASPKTCFMTALKPWLAVAKPKM